MPSTAQLVASARRDLSYTADKLRDALNADPDTSQKTQIGEALQLISQVRDALAPAAVPR